jgi:allantoin racemase
VVRLERAPNYVFDVDLRRFHMTRICFLNPFGTDSYDELIESALRPALQGTTEIEIRHLSHAPANIDYYAPKHLVETDIMTAAIEAEREGFDAFVIGCCYDPALTQCRELVNIPVVGPLEASVMLSRLFGHSFAVVTDHRKAVPELRDRIRLYGIESNCRAVDAIDWYISDMVLDPIAVARDTYAKVQDVMRTSGAETVIIGCTIVSACYELAALRGDAELGSLSVVNPNVMAVKLAEMFADLNATKQYRISRTGYYQQHASHDVAEADEILALLTEHPATKSMVKA